MTSGQSRRALRLVGLCVLASCGPANGAQSPAEPDPEPPDPPIPEPTIYLVRTVVHVLHLGERVGEGHNLSPDRIEGQVRSVNDDYRRREGTRGFNTHPDGADTRIELVLATEAPDGSPTDGVVRVDISEGDSPIPRARSFDHYAHYSYWDPSTYLNVWSVPFPDSATDVVLGEATGPETDLPGAELLIPGEPERAEGVIINSRHFGESDESAIHGLGRTLTHEVGHYLGLLHPWGGRICADNDFCDDTPAVDVPVLGCPSSPPPGCAGEPAMVENYMNFVEDRCMNVFTKDQAARMHYVLENSPRRRSLLVGR